MFSNFSFTRMVGCVYDLPYDKSPDAGHTCSTIKFLIIVTRPTHPEHPRPIFVFNIFKGMYFQSTMKVDVNVVLHANIIGLRRF